MLSVAYCQVGGFGSGQKETHDALASRVMHLGSGEVEMVLGIKANGASNLLLPADRVRRSGLNAALQRQRMADEYESLSPISFSTEKQLAAKLKMFSSKQLARKKSGHYQPRDRSKANNQYTADLEKRSDFGTIRASFEHQRVFYRLCQDTIDAGSLVDYALNLAEKVSDVRICSFAFNLWTSDTRNLNERKADPRVLDVGWTEFNSPTDESDLEAVSTSHWTVEENRMLGNPGRTRMTMPDITRVTKRSATQRELQELFAATLNGQRAPRKLLLVYNEEMTRSVLRSFGVDTSQWEVGIKSLLYRPDRGTNASGDGQSHVGRDPRGYRRDYCRERSRSPRRRTDNEYSGAPSRTRSPPPYRDGNAAPIHLVDIRQLYEKLTREHPLDNSILSSARALYVEDTAPLRNEHGDMEYVAVDPKKWCAGRDSRLLGYMWENMAKDQPIDEQRAARLEEIPLPPLNGPRMGPSFQEDDEDVDPNDVMQPGASGQATGGQAPKPKPEGMYDSQDEDEDY